MPRPLVREAMADEEKFLQENCRQLKDHRKICNYSLVSVTH